MDLSAAEQAWVDACDQLAPDQQVKGLFGGGNYRVNVAKALKAAYLSAKLYIDGKLALATGSVGPIEIAKLGKAAWDVVLATLDAVRERMHPAEYITCMVLSSHGSAGMDSGALAVEVQRFVSQGGAEKLPWYMGLSSSALLEAKKAVEAPGGFDSLLSGLVEDKFVVADGTILTFQERHFDWGFKLS